MSADDPRTSPPERPPVTSLPSVAAQSVELLDELPELPGQARRRRKLVLIGAGHAHLQLLEWFRDRPIRNVDLTLISPYPVAVYSGLLPSVLAGLLPAGDMEIDLAHLTRRCGAELVIDKVIGLDLETRTLDLAVFPERNFDVASINIGSGNVQEELCQSHRAIVAVRPLATFLSRFESRMKEQRQQLRDSSGSKRLNVVVVGAGASGVELALCLEARARREGWPVRISVVERRTSMLPEYAPRTVRLIRKLFRKRGIVVRLGTAVVDCDDDGPSELVLENGQRLRADLAIWAAGPAPPGLLRGYALPKTSAGFLAVRATLQSTADVPVFAAGDVADLVASPCPKAGVFAARQAPVLWENLCRWFQGETLTEFHPQPRSISILSCGDGTAVLDYRGFALRGKWMWRFKQHLDYKFVDRFR